MDGFNGVADLDTVKLFVGQIPRHMTEEQLLPLFQEAGTVHEISIIKDKATKASRGCCFLIYQTKQEADNAIALFHNKRKLPPLSTPMQVKYAEGELERLEHKLFVGMLPKVVTEAELAAVFSPFGVIKELTIIKGSQASKGCAFLKYETKDQATAAIKALNGTYKMEGSATALVVKWADTEKERQARRQQKTQTSGPGSFQAQQQQPSAYGNLPLAYGVSGHVNGYGYQAQNPYSLPQYSTALAGQSVVAGGMVGAANPTVSVPTAGYDLTSGGSSLLATSYGTPQSTGYNYPTIPTPQYAGVYQPNLLPQGAVTPYQTNAMSNPSMAPPVKSAVTSQVEGPPGANLFIYHLPSNFGDHDLSSAFQPFGNVISAKVFVDKNTGLSKCFGFVSYDSPEASQIAINAMNGTQLGGKRLKVQLKKDSRQGRPY